MRSHRLTSAFVVCFVGSLSAAEPAARDIVRQIVGHRGSSADRPENTLASIRRAIEAGATAVEVDVRRTKDGQLVLLHDERLDKTTNGRGPVREMSFEDVRRLDAGSWFGTDKKFAGERIPTLAEALAECRGKADILLDLKEQGDEYGKAVIEEVKKHGDPKRTIAGVRSIEQAKLFRRSLPEARRLGLIPEPDDVDAYVSVGVDTIRLWPKWLTDKSLVERVRFAGAKLHLGVAAGTPEEVLPLLRHRPDSMSADDPARLIATLAAAPPSAFATPDQPAKIPVILDTDIGGDIDDTFALALVLASPELELRAVTTVGGQADDRAWMVCRFLTQTGRRIIPVAAGTSGPRVDLVNWQIQYRRHPAVVWNRTAKPVKESAVELLFNQLKASPGELTILAVGPLTNIARLLETHPECEPWIKRLVIMGGSVRVGYQPGSKPEPEWNIVGDIPAARRVFRSRVPLTVVPLDASATVRLEREDREKLFAARTPLTFQVQSLYELWDQPTPVLFDPVAVASTFTDEFCKFEDLRIDVDDRGVTKVVEGDLRPCKVATSVSRLRFVPWIVQRLAVAEGTIAPPVPKPVVKRRGPREALVGSEVMFETWVHNPSDLSLPNVKIVEANYSSEIAMVEASPGFRRENLLTIWEIPGIPPGQGVVVYMKYKCEKSGLSGRTASIVTCDGVGEVTAEIQTRVRKEHSLANPSKLVERTGFPAKVHVAEDYDTDIEKRWWMTGKAELKDVPPGGRRAQRAVLTQDYDDLQGDTRAMYRAVIFNPVPGPPMGPNTRLSFRYKLSGTDQLRVQLYSLSNGYHRYLSLSGLPQGQWQEGTVDMTQMRRPDGTGGPLAADERIDDIQFYIDPRAELLIDDVILYDVAAPDEKRPFPKRIVFTGWFDTGKQGQEWPGEFEIVPHASPLKWKFAKSVLNADTKTPWIRVSLRGERRVDPGTELTFRYRLTGGESLRVELRHAKSGRTFVREVASVQQGDWATATLAFEIPSEAVVDEIRFLPPTGSELGVDDVLLYTK